MMDKEYRAHILAVPYPSQGHVNPLLQFCKSLASKGVKTTLAITKFISKSTNLKVDCSVSIATISDGCDGGGFMEAESIADYLARMEVAGSKTLEEIIEANKKSNQYPIDCIVYDAFLPWALEVAQRCGIKGASFFTQACAVNYVYYYVHHGMLTLPVKSTPIEIPGMPLLDLPDMPSFIHKYGTNYPAYFDMVLNQFSNTDKADFVLVNTWYELEEKVVDAMNKVCPLLTIGPTVPSFYFDERFENDRDYGLNLFQVDSTDILNWLNTKPTGSVVYVAFGSMVNLTKPQMEEIASALESTNFHFLWVIKESDKLEKLPKDFVRETKEKCLLVNWSPQLQVLSNRAIGCFYSHAGWNSTMEALCLGVPMVVMPQWTDQTTDAKFVQDVWQVGVRVRVDDDGMVRREEIESCLREVMEGKMGKVFKRNAIKYRDMAKEAVSEDGSSYANIEKFILEIGKHA